ncbi:GT4 family glycosyltransferase PelF [Granulicoccus phenolivorans]|uniref:GT4 family glycosyltransferase PelF n=1 Tax=Granulicoccus phenolivorans TaxID=266854 RepID=UPI0004085FD1|nr:GT4 family glycosyltransferase PelF [Granulicoccus phenolivorans]
MRVGLFTEGTYPVTSGGVSTWCEHLITGLPEHTFVPITLIGGTETARSGLPDNVAEVTLVPMWGHERAPVPIVDSGDAAALGRILRRLWTAVLPAEGDGDLAGFTACLKELTGWRGHRLGSLLSRHGSTRHIIDAWTRHRTGRADLPVMTLADAAAAAAMVDRILALADRRFPEVDISHVASNGSPSILALGRWWQHGTPIVVTEHGIYLRERLLALAAGDLNWSTRSVIGTFLRLLTQATYAEAVAIAPVSDFNRDWELYLGADPSRTRTIYNGVDTTGYRPIGSEPAEPTVVFVGRIDPLKALEVLVDAFALVRDRVPGARLRIFGPTPSGNEAYLASLQEQVRLAGLTESVSFEGAVESSMTAFEAATVVALSSISEGLPYGVIEAMMAGRPSVNTDVGGVAEIVGRDGTCGIVVPPRDPEAFAAALTDLLTDPARRHALGRAARERATRLFNMADFLDAYRDLYRRAYDSADHPLVGAR